MIHFVHYARTTMKASKELVEFVEELCKEANHVYNCIDIDRDGNGTADPDGFSELIAGCRLLVKKLGPFGKVWDQMLDDPQNEDVYYVKKIQGVLRTISKALTKGHLVTIEEAVSAEVLGDLLEHAEELIKAKYHLAAAIILRAVLEERLRKLCESNNCMPTSQRPTIESFKQSLQAATVIDKIGVKDIDWMAGVGNAAAHNLPEYKDEDVPPFYGRVTAFLARFSMA
jgi:hypothetical protein